MRQCLFILAIGCAALSGTRPAVMADGLAEDASAAGITFEPANGDTQNGVKRAAIAEQLRIARRSLQDNPADSTDSSPPGSNDLSREVELLKQLDALIAQQDSAKVAEQELQTRQADLAAQVELIETGRPDPEAPDSFLKLDEIRDRFRRSRSVPRPSRRPSPAANDAVAAARTRVDEHQKTLRRLREDNARGEATDGRRTLAEKLAALELQLAIESLSLRKHLLANEQLNAGIHDLQLTSLRARIVAGEASVRFTEAELEDQLVDLEKREADTQRAIESAQANLEYSERQWFEARQRLDAAGDDTSALQEEVEARRLSRQMRQQQIAAYNARLQRLSRNREIWNRRYFVVNDNPTTEDLLAWREDARNAIEQLARERRINQQRITELRELAGEVSKKLDAAAADTRRWLRDQQASVEKLIKVYTADAVSIEDSHRLQSKLLAEIQAGVNQWSLGEWLQSAWHHVGTAWNTELTKVDDRPITIGKVIVGVLLVCGGFWVSRLLSRVVGNRLHRNFRIEEGAASAIQSVAFYVLLVLFTLTSLKFANVPLTIFTLLGGAVAIGVGFGSQNILNNFISGLILLAERPIKVGDLIQLNELYGNVVKIGARSTQIRTGENLDIIVPNSKFLENNVVNLTLGDDKLRTHVDVGVVYGSPTREVSRFLQRAVEEHGQVLNSPKPFVWFVEFGSDSLNFQVHFWVKARTLAERIRVESDVRYRIDQLFRDAQIVIAFPQRDIHIDTTHPLEVRLTAEASSESPDSSAPRSSAA